MTCFCVTETTRGVAVRVCACLTVLTTMPRLSTATSAEAADVFSFRWTPRAWWGKQLESVEREGGKTKAQGGQKKPYSGPWS